MHSSSDSNVRTAQLTCSRTTQFKAMLSAAFVAIFVNTVILKIAPLFHINAAAGGLFGLLRRYFGTTFVDIGFSVFWTTAHLPQPGTLLFYIFFHTLVGLVMSILYVFFIEKYLTGSGWQKGAIFSLLPWLINSFIVMPILGKGFAAAKVLDMTGITYFFVANASYGILLGHLYEKFTPFFVKAK